MIIREPNFHVVHKILKDNSEINHSLKCLCNLRLDTLVEKISLLAKEIQNRILPSVALPLYISTKLSRIAYPADLLS